MILEQSSMDMRKWFYAIHLVLNGKKGISSCQLRRGELGFDYKTSLADVQALLRSNRECQD
jgi:hypothetical protein